MGQTEAEASETELESLPINAAALRFQAIRDLLNPAVQTPAEELLGLVTRLETVQDFKSSRIAENSVTAEEDSEAAAAVEGGEAGEDQKGASVNRMEYRFGSFRVRSSDISGVQLETQRKMLSLTENNMKAFYERSSWGWDRRKKKRELTHPSARYILVLDNEADKVAAFCHFRFEVDDDDEPERAVLYCYELQVHPEYQRKGLGRHLMAILHDLARHFRLPYILLTVFKRNKAARGFYETLGYTLDANDPSKWRTRADYCILSKPISESRSRATWKVQDLLSCLCAFRIRSPQKLLKAS